jgi:CRISPR-associated protein Csb1
MMLTYEALRAAVAGGVAGARSLTRFEPLGGPDDKIFPPTYGVGDRELRYAVEERVVGGGNGTMTRVASVLVDSVASQANRAELALLAAIRDGRLAAPVTSVDFAAHGLYGIDRVSDYEAPHRIFDALLRDSFDGDDLFRDGPAGRAITGAVPRNAAALLRHSPHTLVFGGWDSTGPKGGRGAKYERALTSEIVAHGIATGVKTASRIDPVAIETKAGPVYLAGDDVGWTIDPAHAITDKKGEPALYTGKGDKPGRPTLLNHGNVKPSIDSFAGGVTAERIVGTTVLSFIQLRRLRFPTAADGAPIPPEHRHDAEIAARTALAALGLAATVLAQDEGFDLRSRCVLVPTEPFTLELVGRSGAVETTTLDDAAALTLVAKAAERADQHGLGWRPEELVLRPSDRLVALIRKSQEQSVAGDVNE